MRKSALMAAMAVGVILAAGAARAQVAVNTISANQSTYAGEVSRTSTTMAPLTSTNGTGCERFGSCNDIAKTTVTGSPASGVSAYAYNAANGLGNYATADASIEFTVSVGGLTDKTLLVPLVAIGEVDLSASSENAASDVYIGISSFGVLGGPPQFPEYHCGDTGDDCGVHPFQISFVLGFTDAVGYAGDVYLEAEARTFEGHESDSHFANTVIDPTFAIDPDFLREHPEAYLVFSDGIGNGGPGGVPEPASWALMIAGFGLAGAALRRRRTALA
jgi:hypothetical protein